MGRASPTRRRGRSPEGDARGRRARNSVCDMEPEARGAPALVLTQQQQPWPWPEPAEREVGSRGQHPPTVTSLRGAWLVPAFTPRGCCFLGCPVLRKEGRKGAPWSGFLLWIQASDRWLSPTGRPPHHPGACEVSLGRTWSNPEAWKGDVPPPPRPSGLCFNAAASCHEHGSPGRAA